ncbi:MAG: CoA-binding protein [Terriglobia bacterium]
MGSVAVHHRFPSTARSGAVPSAFSDRITDILERYKTLAVVGLSPKPSRPSHGVAAYMRSHGYRVVPVNPAIDSIFHEHCYASLGEIREPVDAVIIFRRSEFVPAIVEEAIQIGAKVIWMQEGVQHKQAAHRARDAGLEVVEDRCILKEHAKRFVTHDV